MTDEIRAGKLIRLANLINEFCEREGIEPELAACSLASIQKVIIDKFPSELSKASMYRAMQDIAEQALEELMERTEQ